MTLECLFYLQLSFTSIMTVIRSSESLSESSKAVENIQAFCSCALKLHFHLHLSPSSHKLSDAGLVVLSADSTSGPDC